MLNENKVSLVRHRLTTAKEDYEAAVDLLKNEYYKAANNRAYYSIFHSIRALLAVEGIDFKKHSAVIAYFNKKYVKTGVFEKRFSKIINAASLIRNESDYSDFYVVCKEETEVQIENAKKFYDNILKYIEELIEKYSVE